MRFLKRMYRAIFWAASYVRWVFQYLSLLLGFNRLGEIKIVSVEFSSVCNLHCKYCNIEQGGRSRFLDIALYEKLIRELCQDHRYRIRTMEWPISGEFFVYPKWREVVNITRRYMNEYPQFRPHIILNDNMVLMDEAKIDFLLRSGVVNQIICSVDGHDASSFEDMRPPAKFDRVAENIKTLHRRNRELGSRVFIQINNGRDERSVGLPLSPEMTAVFELGSLVTYWKPELWNESFNSRVPRFHPAKGFCTFVFNSVTLSSSGQVSKCCMDLKGSTVYGDLASYSLAQIWHSQSRRRFLDLMLRNRRSALPGCQTCAITAVDNDNRHMNALRRLKLRLMQIVA